MKEKILNIVVRIFCRFKVIRFPDKHWGVAVKRPLDEWRPLVYRTLSARLAEDMIRKLKKEGGYLWAGR